MAFSRSFFVGAILSGAALSLVSAGTAGAANLIVNGGFELSNNGFSETQTPVGWTNIGHIDGVIAYSLFNTPPYQGNYFYDEGGFGDPGNNPGDGIEQTVATVTGQQYTLTFGLTGENNGGTEIADVMIGSMLTQYTLTTNPSFGELTAPFTTESISYVATGSSTTIAFTTDAASPSFGNNDPMIDGISFTGSTVPEPSTWAMMLLGFAGLAFAGCRSSGKSVELTA
jgi:hypothetical protein